MFYFRHRKLIGGEWGRSSGERRDVHEITTWHFGDIHHFSLFDLTESRQSAKAKQSVILNRLLIRGCLGRRGLQDLHDTCLKSKGYSGIATVSRHELRQNSDIFGVTHSIVLGRGRPRQQPGSILEEQKNRSKRGLRSIFPASNWPS